MRGFINEFKTITGETQITDLIPKGYKFVGSNVNYEYETNHLHSVLKIKIPIEKKPKTLEYYENIMLEKSIFKVQNYWLKENHPKQYYSIIFQMIANDICDKKMEFNWCVAFHYGGQVDYRNLINETKPQGTILFDTLAHIKQAHDLLGENIKYLL